MPRFTNFYTPQSGSDLTFIDAIEEKEYLLSSPSTLGFTKEATIGVPAKWYDA